MTGKHRKSFVAAAAAAALALTGAAQAHVEQLAPTSAQSTSYASYYRALALRSAGLDALYSAARSSDDRAGIRGAAGAVASEPVATPSDFRRFDDASLSGSRASADDRAGIRGVGPAPVAAPIALHAPSAGFDWGDFGIGAACALGVVGLLCGLLVAAGRRPRSGHLAV